ncbi:hypothetical protein TcCL_Unassigned03872 [Trypanosoma cruzi]|nr:hypothetical protein TcCL_Unassigned03872 [Trypanosoma cruzi]
MNLQDLPIVSGVWEAFQLPAAELVETCDAPGCALMVAKLSFHQWMWTALASAPIGCAPHGTARGHLSCTPIFFSLQLSLGTPIWVSAAPTAFLQVPPNCSKQWCASSSSERLEWTQGSSAR